MCLVVALLPAVPLTFVVRSLLDKSFDLGLHSSVEDALQSGLSVSRSYLNDVRTDFSLNVQRTVGAIGETRPDSVGAAAALARAVGGSGAVDGLLVSHAAVRQSHEETRRDIPSELRPFADHPLLGRLLEETSVIDRNGGGITGYSFFDVQDRSSFIAVWNPSEGAALNRGRIRDAGSKPHNGEYRVLFYKKVDSAFLENATRLIEGSQNVAALKLLQRSLAESFFFPFLIIYSACLLIALALALLMAERLTDPIRRLVRGADAVAEGDWDYRLDIKAGGETGRLIDAFNSMVGRLETQRRRLTDMEKMATWREMARHLAHEIKNPLLPIRLTVEELRDQYDGEDPKYREMLNESTRVVGDELSSLQNLVKEFSSFARMPDMNPAPGSLGQLVNDVAQMYAQINASIETTSPLPAFPFDSDQIRRVLVNLLDNAVSVGASRVRIALAAADGDVTLTITDNGPGISREHVDKVFEPYFTTRAEGTGLGLAMVKKIVLLHGGSITASSREGEGVTFEIRLPLSGPPLKPEDPGSDAVGSSGPFVGEQ
jgi:nitrogen fixation/metabolism regulation signal transduction histidine kinase